MEPAQRSTAADLRGPHGTHSQVFGAGRRAPGRDAGRWQAHARLGPARDAVRAGDSRQGELPPDQSTRSVGVRRQAEPTRHRGTRAEVLRPGRAQGGDARGPQGAVRRVPVERSVLPDCVLRRLRRRPDLGRVYWKNIVQVRGRRGDAAA